jgi:competence protein ComEC
VLLTSDIEARDEQALLAAGSGDLLRSEVLLVPHHGSATSSTPDFVAAVGAR